jgi:hypothetical protein
VEVTLLSLLAARSKIGSVPKTANLDEKTDILLRQVCSGGSEVEKLLQDCADW